MQNLYVNENGKQFAGAVRSAKSKKSYEKKVKFYVHRYDGFGIQASLLDDLVEKGYETIVFVVTENLVDYRKTDRRGRYKTICAMGRYSISIQDLMAHGTLDTLNEKHGEQWFIGKGYCASLGG